MREICDRDKCTGCMACINACPKNAIKIVDRIASIHAEICQDKCIDCGACVKICPVRNKRDLLQPIYWKQGWADEAIRRNSSSGGAASALMKSFIASGGYVASCLFDKGDFSFAVTNNVETAKRFSGSKYVKSNPGAIYKEIKKLLKQGERVLFIGLPCQSAAVQNFCNNHENLYTVDLICHGTPSSLLLKQFLTEKGINWTDIAGIQFRENASFGLTANGIRLTPRRVQDSYTKAFLRSLDYTDNCYSCRYAKLHRVSDITLGDAWGQLSETESDGVSLILCQTQRGVQLIEQSNLKLEEVDLQKAVDANKQLKQPSIKHPARDRFLSEIMKGHSIDRAIMVVFPKESIKQSVKTWLIKLHLLKDTLPSGGGTA